MCQLAAYIGDRPIAQTLLRSLELQEAYFGGHATGLGVITEDGELRVEKDVGPVARVRSTTAIEKLEGKIGIAHSRFGYGFYDPRYNTRRMAHPFPDCGGTICLMHNGTISNYKTLWQALRDRHRFSSYEPEVDSITDSEVAVHMLEEYVERGLGVGEGLRRVAQHLEGSFLLACITLEEPEAVWIANWHQPCVIALGEGEAMFCSSPSGLNHLREHLDRVFEPPKNSLIRLTRGGVEISPLDPSRRVPNLRLNREELGRAIMEILERRGEVDFRELHHELNPNGWARALGITPNEFEELRRKGISIVNPYIETLEMLVGEKKINCRVDRRLEAGVEGVPRLAFSPIKI
jgi:glutamine phosphoribosylpyrophosphate amidotransferase